MNQFSPRRCRNPDGNFRHQRDIASVREFVEGGGSGAAFPGEFMNGWSIHPPDRISRKLNRQARGGQTFLLRNHESVDSQVLATEMIWQLRLHHFFVTIGEG